MQKKAAVRICLFFLLTLTLFTQPVLAGAEFGRNPPEKLARGIFHFLTSPFQIPKEVIQVASETEPFYMSSWKGMTTGLGNGLYQMGRQMYSGMFDVYTFPTPAGRDWEPIFASETLFPEV